MEYYLGKTRMINHFRDIPDAEREVALEEVRRRFEKILGQEVRMSEEQKKNIMNFLKGKRPGGA